MKRTYKFLFSALILFTTTLTYATNNGSVSECNLCDLIYTPKIKHIGNYLYTNYPPGIRRYFITSDIQTDMSKWEIYAFSDFIISDFIIFNDNSIIATTKNSYNQGDIFIKKESEFSDEIRYTPKDLSLFFNEYSITDFSINNLYQSPKSENILYAISDKCIFKSIDSGISWKNIKNSLGYLDYHNTTFKISPFDENILFTGYHNSFYEGCFDYSLDGGSEWQHPIDETLLFPLDSYIFAADITFHPTDENIIILSGGKVIMTENKCITWQEKYNDSYSTGYWGIYFIEFDTRNNKRMYGTSDGAKIMYSDDFGKTWNEYYSVNHTDDSNIVDLIQINNKIYLLSHNHSLYELDLELIDSAVEEVAEDSLSLTISADTLQFSSASEIAQVEIYRADGILLHSAESNANDGNIDISTLSDGVHIAVFTTSDGQTISKKIHIIP